jgi:hypothetical protein
MTHGKPPNFSTFSRSEWYSFLKDALFAQDELERLLAIIRCEGVYQFGSGGLREAATLLQQEQEGHSQAVHWLLKRLQHAGLPPSYPCYIATEVLTAAWPEALGSAQAGRNTLRLLYDLVASLLEVPELADHPRREVLEQRAHAIMEQCREHTFSHHFPDCPIENVVKVSLLPESPVRDELIFMRVVQSTELVFTAASRLAAKALEAIAYSDALEALCALHWLVCMETYLLPFLRLLSPMSIENWLAFRPLIVRPSAIQSIAFHDLSTHLSELSRVVNHPRYAREQRAYLPCCQELLNTSVRHLHVWYRAHTQIASKYSRSRTSSSAKPEGVNWLEQQPLNIPAAATPALAV